MKNKYGISENELRKIRVRDKVCVYCHKKMIEPSDNNCRKDWATIEHLNHLPPWDNSSTVAICCGSCNSSRGNEKLLDWFEILYCIEKNINYNTVAQPVKDYIENHENK
ncbi:MAG: HNH endonuclease [Patescibacteria group bacterium]